VVGAAAAKLREPKHVRTRGDSQQTTVVLQRSGVANINVVALLFVEPG